MAAILEYQANPLAIGPIRILGLELDLAWSGGSCGGIFSYVNVFPRKSLHFMLDPVQYLEYEYGELNSIFYAYTLFCFIKPM